MNCPVVVYAASWLARRPDVARRSARPSLPGRLRARRSRSCRCARPRRRYGPSSSLSPGSPQNAHHRIHAVDRRPGRRRVRQVDVQCRGLADQEVPEPGCGLDRPGLPVFLAGGGPPSPARSRSMTSSRRSSLSRMCRYSDMGATPSEAARPRMDISAPRPRRRPTAAGTMSSREMVPQGARPAGASPPCRGDGASACAGSPMNQIIPGSCVRVRKELCSLRTGTQVPGRRRAGG